MLNLLARNTDPETSHEKMETLKKSNHSERVLEALRNSVITMHGADLNIETRAFGLTSSELSQLIGVARDSISPLMPQLENKSLVWRTGYKRKIANGYQIVWVLYEHRHLYTPSELDVEMGRPATRITKQGYQQIIATLLKFSTAELDAETRARAEAAIGMFKTNENKGKN